MGQNLLQSRIPWKIRLQAIWKKFLVALLYTAIMVVIILAMTQVEKIFVIERPASERDQNILQNFIEWFAVIYTLALSLIISNAWIRHNRINSEIDREADELALMIQIAKMCGNKMLSDKLARSIRVYVNYTRTTTHKDVRAAIEANEKIQLIYGWIAQMVADDRIKDSVKSELMAHYAQFFDARGDRFDLLAQRLPIRVWVILGAFSVAWLWGFFWLDFCAGSISVYISSCTVFSITILFGYAIDLDNPTTGFWRMDFTPFQENRF